MISCKIPETVQASDSILRLGHEGPVAINPNAKTDASLFIQFATPIVPSQLPGRSQSPIPHAKLLPVFASLQEMQEPAFQSNRRPEASERLRVESRPSTNAYGDSAAQYILRS